MTALILFFVLSYLAGKVRTFSMTLDDTAILMGEKHGRASVEFYRERLEPAWLEPMRVTIYMALGMILLWFWFNYRMELALEMTIGLVILLRGADMVLPPARGANIYLDIAEAIVSRDKAAAERSGEERDILAAGNAADALALVRAPLPLEPWRREYYEH